MIVIHSNVLSAMHGFRENDVLLPTGHDVITSPPPDMTSSWFIRKMALQAIFHDGFWKSDHDFLITLHINFLYECMVFEITRFYCKPDMTSSWFHRQRALHAIFLDGSWKSELEFRIAFHSNFLSGMYGFRDNEVLFQSGYDVIVISPLGGASGDF